MRAALSLLALLAATPALAQSEETVTIDTALGPVIGTLETPAGGPAPVVLLLHGFTGSRDELPVTGTEEGVFSRTARLLAAEGIASLRIDFRGSGESPGAFADTTFEGQVADGLAALDWLEANPAVDGQRLGLIGWSQGGLVATAVAGRSDKPDALVLWAAVANPEESFGGIVGAETLDKGLCRRRCGGADHPALGRPDRTEARLLRRRHHLRPAGRTGLLRRPPADRAWHQGHHSAADAPSMLPGRA